MKFRFRLYPNNTRLSALYIYFKSTLNELYCKYLHLLPFIWKYLTWSSIKLVSNFRWTMWRHIRCKSENTSNENVELPYVDRECGFLDRGSPFDRVKCVCLAFTPLGKSITHRVTTFCFYGHAWRTSCHARAPIRSRLLAPVNLRWS